MSHKMTSNATKQTDLLAGIDPARLKEWETLAAFGLRSRSA